MITATASSPPLFPDGIDPTEDAPASPATQPPGNPLIDRLNAARDAANRLVAAGNRVRACAQATRDAEQALYRAARDAAAVGITWPDIHAALGNPTKGADPDLPTPAALYGRVRQLDD